jgi:hypothetical protein
MWSCAAVVLCVLVLAWAKWLKSSQQSAWIEAVRATGAKAGVDRPDYDDVGEIISKITRGDLIVVWSDQPEQTARILELPAAPGYVWFNIVHPAEHDLLKTIRERFPHSSVAHHPRLTPSDLRGIKGWEDVK